MAFAGRDDAPLRGSDRRRAAAAVVGFGADFGGGGDFSDFFSQFFGAARVARAADAAAAVPRAGFQTRFRHGTGGAPDLRAEVGLHFRCGQGAKRRLDLVARTNAPRAAAVDDRRRKNRVRRVSFDRRGVSDLRRQRCSRRAAHIGSHYSAGRDRRNAVAIEGSGPAPKPDQNGDLFLTIKIEPNPVFAIAGRDLRVQSAGVGYEAALGAEIPPRRLTGRVVAQIPSRQARPDA